MSKSTPQSRKSMRARTKLVYAGRAPEDQFGFVNTPIYRGSTVLFPDVATLESRAGSRFRYGTYGTPTTEALEQAWTEISGAADTVLAPSGLAACCLALLTALSSGDHVLVTDSAYGPTRSFCEQFLTRMGIETTFYDPLVGADIANLFKPNTKAVLVEAPGSQSFEMQDIPAIAAVAHDKDACVIMDNTWATPLFFPAHERGVDLSADAGTKYLSGHSDLLLGLVSANGKWARKLRQTYQLFSNCAGQEDAWLALRGLRTMELRLREAESQGLAMARWLEQRPEVSRVLHPALESFPGHAIWKRDFLGSTGLFSVVLKPASQDAVAAMLDGLELFGLGYSWGGFESLVIPFDCSSYRAATVWAPEGPTLRFSIGFEDIEDLKDDLDKGFARLRARA